MFLDDVATANQNFCRKIANVTRLIRIFMILLHLRAQSIENS